MKRSRSRFLILGLCLFLLIPLFPRPASAYTTSAAANISAPGCITDHTGFPTTAHLFDGQLLFGWDTPDSASLTLEHSEGIGSLYFLFGREYGSYTVTDNTTGQVLICGEDRFLHEFLDLEAAFGTAPSSVTVNFGNGSVLIYELYLFTAGQVPDFVQRWNAPREDKTDLILFSTHGDDEQLFFAGLLPYYAGEKELQVQVVYLTDHRNNSQTRIHEMLNGLWAVGVTTYPVFGPYPDFRVGDMPLTYTYFESYGFPREQMLGFVVEQLRRFNPLVVVGHDFNGEYRHGQHMVYADLLAKALEISNDPAQYPELAEAYGTWDVPKAYFHLYWENEILMDWDQPLEKFGGMTAFQVTKELGFPCHVSQQQAFGFWINPYNSAAQIPEHNPRAYGLYRSTVGADVRNNDMFENVIPYADQARLAEEAKLAEEARLQAQEEARKKAEEAALREEEARIREEEQARIAEEARLSAQKKAELLQQRNRSTRSLIATLCIITLCTAIYGILILSFRVKKKS